MPTRTKAGSRASKRSRAIKKENFYDYSLLAVVIILISFGLIMLYSASAYESTMNFETDMYYFLRQVIFSVVALVLALFFSIFDYHRYQRLALPLYFISIVLMAMVRFTPLGLEINGARRWLGFGGFSFQPSEVGKIALILVLSVVISKMGRNVGTAKGTMLIAGIGIIQFLCVFVLTDNLSTALIVLGICVFMLLLVHPNTRAFILLFVIAGIVVAVFLLYLRANMESSDYFRMRRILVWMDPAKYLSDGGYQVMQGLYAIGSGGFFGKGLGNSTQKLSTIPEAQNDMIFSIICEELGLFGAILVLLMFGYLLYRLFVIAQNAKDLLGKLIVTGIFIHIALQVILNICVVLNVIPTTGVTLPFVSYGGTSVLFLMMEIGIALNVSRQIT